MGRGTAAEPFAKGRLCCDLDGFSLHAAVRLPAGLTERIERLCRYAARPPIVGVRDHNVRELVEATAVTEVHLSAASQHEGGMQFRRTDVPMGTEDETVDIVRTTDGEMVARVKAQLDAT